MFSVSLASIVLTPQRKVPLDEWPAPLKDSRLVVCTLDTFHACHEDDWFGIVESQLVVKRYRYDKDERVDFGVLEYICQKWGGDPDSDYVRKIEVDGDMLWLCRMKAPDMIVLD